MAKRLRIKTKNGRRDREALDKAKKLPNRHKVNEERSQRAKQKRGWHLT
jgi:hypothetical protein